MADAGVPSDEQIDSENMDFNNSDTLANVLSGANDETGANLEEENMMDVDGEGVDAPIGDVSAGAQDNKMDIIQDGGTDSVAAGGGQPTESDLHLIQLQPNNDAQDPAELPLLTFGLEPPNEGGLAQEEGFLGIDAKPDKVAEGTETPMLGDEALEKECIKIEVVSQRQRRTIAVDPDYNVLQLKSMVQAKFQVDVEQICLLMGQRILGDEEVLRDLDLEHGSEILLAIRYYPQSSEPTEGEPANQAFFWPSQYARLGLVNFDLGELQEQMQKQFNENPELVREALMNPMVQDLMCDPGRVKEMMLSCPGGHKLLEKRPDIAEALSDPKIMEESLNIAQDQGLLEETLSKMDAMKDPERMPSITTLGPQEIPSPETMMKMMCQNPDLLVKMFNSPSYKAMIEGMIANPAWTEKMLMNNPLVAANPHMKNQVKSFLPMFLNQLQNPEYVSMMSNPKALKAMMKVQQGIFNLQNEASNLTSSMGFPNYSSPGTFNIQVEGDNEPEEAMRPSRGEVDPMSIMMAQIARQNKEGTIGLPTEERYAKDLELMERMGFSDRQTNIALLTATFGDVNAAASQLLL